MNIDTILPPPHPLQAGASVATNRACTTRMQSVPLSVVAGRDVSTRAGDTTFPLVGLDAVTDFVK